MFPTDWVEDAEFVREESGSLVFKLATGEIIYEEGQIFGWYEGSATGPRRGQFREVPRPIILVPGDKYTFDALTDDFWNRRPRRKATRENQS